LKALVDGCSDAFWADGAKSYLHTVQEERADTLIKIALYYERLFVTGKSTGNRGAISRYEFILANYPHYSRTDYLLLILGNAYSSAGEWEKGFSTYTRLINEFPTSKYVRNAYRHLD
jgi:outer membrane protein assembly factor BamD (BamD/ComL family)